jgi:hypothetical protein
VEQAVAVVVAAAEEPALLVAAVATERVQALDAYKRQPSNPRRRKARQPAGNVA